MTGDDEPIDLRALTRRLRMDPYTGPVQNLSLRADLGATPAEVFATLADEQRHSELTGRKAHINRQIATPFTLGDGAAEGYLTELVEGRHIVLAWRLTDDRWPDNHYSTVTFLLRREGVGTTLVVFQQDVPQELVDDITALWQHDYVDTLSALYPSR